MFCIGSDHDLLSNQLWGIGKLLSARILLENKATDIKVYHRLLKSRLLYVSRLYGRGRCVSPYVKYSVTDQTYYGNIEFFLKVKVCACS